MNFSKWFDIYKLSKEQKHTHKDQMEDAWNVSTKETIKVIDNMILNSSKDKSNILRLLKIAIKKE